MLRTLAAALLTAALATTPALATEFIKNGNFSATSATTSRQMSSADGKTQYVDSWYNASNGNYSGYNFIVMGDQGTQKDGIQSNSAGSLYLWSKYSDDANAKSNGFTSSASIKGSGGNYLAADGAYQENLIMQTITGLTVGQKYTLSFNWAGAQQHGFNGATTEAWDVYFGTSDKDFQSFNTGSIDNVEHGFTGWRQASTTFTATSATSTLAFLAKGTPDGVPPFSLLDDVSMTEYQATSAVPEPASWALMIGGFGLLGTTMRRRRAGPTLAA